MKAYANKSENQSRTLDSNARASKQAPLDKILQAYTHPVVQQQGDIASTLHSQEINEDYNKGLEKEVDWIDEKVIQYKKNNLKSLVRKSFNSHVSQFYVKTTFGGVSGYSSSAKDKGFSEAGRDKSIAKFSNWRPIKEALDKIPSKSFSSKTGTYMRDAYDCAEPNAFANYLDKAKDGKGYVTKAELNQKTFGVAQDMEHAGQDIPPCAVCNQWMDANSPIALNIADKSDILFPLHPDTSKVTDDARGYNEGYGGKLKTEEKGYDAGKKERDCEYNAGYEAGKKLANLDRHKLVSILYKAGYTAGIESKAVDDAKADGGKLEYFMRKAVSRLEEGFKQLYQKRYNIEFGSKIREVAQKKARETPEVKRDTPPPKLTKMSKDFQNQFIQAFDAERKRIQIEKEKKEEIEKERRKAECASKIEAFRKKEHSDPELCANDLIQLDKEMCEEEYKKKSQEALYELFYKIVELKKEMEREKWITVLTRIKDNVVTNQGDLIATLKYL